MGTSLDIQIVYLLGDDNGVILCGNGLFRKGRKKPRAGATGGPPRIDLIR